MYTLLPIVRAHENELKGIKQSCRIEYNHSKKMLPR